MSKTPHTSACNSEKPLYNKNETILEDGCLAILRDLLGFSRHNTSIMLDRVKSVECIMKPFLHWRNGIWYFILGNS